MPTPRDHISPTILRRTFVGMALAAGYQVAALDRGDGLANNTPKPPTFLLRSDDQDRVVVVVCETNDQHRSDLAAGPQGWVDVLGGRGVELLRVCPSNLWDAVARLREIGAGQ